MTTDKTIHHGRFVWRELMTTDLDKSRGFYGELFNWKIEDVDMGPMKYPMIHNDGRPQGGLMTVQMPGQAPHWRSFISHNDVDEAARRVTSNGGQVVFGPETMGPGRAVIATDPSGAHLSLWHSTEGDAPLPERPSVGEFCWEDLMTPDADAVKDFYASVVGWTTEGFPGNESITIFKSGDVMVGGINTNAPKGAPAHWLTYVVVESLSAARQRADRLGGTVMLEEVPVGDFGKISIIRDNVGAGIGLFEGTSA